MKNYNIKIYYLYHSSFAVETLNHFLIFDYYKDSLNSCKHTLENGLISKDIIKDKKNILVFSSHSHPDHFNPIILKWQESNPNIKYIFSSDIQITNSKKNYYSLSPYENINLNNVYIKAYGSTDIGVSFFIKIDGVSIFHAGDLNLWYWKEDSKEEQKTAKENFEKEISTLKDETIDFAFFPLDPRLGEYYSSGGEYFINELKPKFFIPMHFWDKYSITKDFAELTKNNSSRSLVITHKGQLFEF
ncbi:MBL fold metallo-hydrolase [Clostridium sp. WILCCON 0269]|uniref:MBL fold metallo-hydrolase n=1 Tax=Candidatus Clostridium eludens TaxID=3381663 RepID=A0ABW8SHH5_9CLOT